MWNIGARVHVSRVREQKYTEKPEIERDASRRVSITCERVR